MRSVAVAGDADLDQARDGCALQHDEGGERAARLGEGKGPHLAVGSETLILRARGEGQAEVAAESECLVGRRKLVAEVGRNRGPVRGERGGAGWGGERRGGAGRRGVVWSRAWRVGVACPANPEEQPDRHGEREQHAADECELPGRAGAIRSPRASGPRLVNPRRLGQLPRIGGLADAGRGLSQRIIACREGCADALPHSHERILRSPRERRLQAIRFRFPVAAADADRNEV